MVAWYKHDIPAWMDGTEGLSDGAYRAYHVICQLIYLNEGSITLNEHGIAGRCHQSVRGFRKHLSELLEVGKLKLINGRLSNSRADKELEKVEHNRENAAKGGQNSGKVENQTTKPLKNKGVDEASLKEDASLKTREEKTRAAAAREGADQFSKIEAAVHAALPAEATWKLKRCFDYSPIVQCLAEGADLERDVVQAIREVSRRVLAEGKTVGVWSFFEQPIRDRMRARGLLRTIPQAAETDWNAWAKRFAEFGDWPKALGSAPGFAGCRCPSEVLRANGIDAATGEKIKPQGAAA